MTIARIGQDHWIERGMRIERARDWLGVNQGQLAAAMQEMLNRTYSRTVISNIENGERNVSVDELRVLAYLLDQSEEWLDAEEGAEFNDTPLPQGELHSPRYVKLSPRPLPWFVRPMESYADAA